MTTKKKSGIGFGFDPSESPSHFAVAIPQDDRVHVTIEERYAWGDVPNGEPPRPPSPKAYLDAYRWSRIAEIVRAQLNKRLRDAGIPAAQWKVGGETLVAPHFGKELTLLAWAIEDADPTLIPNMVANWLGLAPEERWWLYTTINATSGHPEHRRDRGWRKAIKIAFAENPAGATADRLSDVGAAPIRLPLPVDVPLGPPAQAAEQPEEGPASPAKPRRGRRQAAQAQLIFHVDDP